MEANKKNTASSIMEMLSNGNSNDEVSDNKSLQIIEQENQKQDEPVLLFNQRSEEDKKKDELERFKQQVKNNILPIVLSPIVGIICSLVYYWKQIYYINQYAQFSMLSGCERMRSEELAELNSESGWWFFIFYIFLFGIAWGVNWLYENLFTTHKYRNFSFSLSKYCFQLYGGVMLIGLFQPSNSLVIVFYLAIIGQRLVGLNKKKY